MSNHGGIFVTSVHCMDGRIQEPLIEYLKKTFNADYVDAVTEPGPCKILAECADNVLLDTIKNRINISVNVHGSKVIAISGHYDCAGNPCDDETQKLQIKDSAEYLENTYQGIKVVRLWIDRSWRVSEI